jgi:hypothetical protein
MKCLSRGLSNFARWRSQVARRAVRYAVMTFFLAASGLIAGTAPSSAAPVAPHRDTSFAGPSILVRDYCCHGYHRENKQRNKAGAWVGNCIPNKPKKQQPVSQPPGQPPATPGGPPQNRSG